MVETLEAPATDTAFHWGRSDLTTMHTLAEDLRILAEWVQRHEVTNAEVISVSADGFRRRQVHLYLAAVRRIFPGRTISLDDGGHGAIADGPVIVAFIVHGEKPKEVQL